MSFKRNDIVNKQRLRDALEEDTSMGFAHNDIVTTYAMDKAIAEGGGGGGGGEFTKWHVIVNCPAIDDNYIAYNAYQEGDSNHYYSAFVEEDGHYYFSYGLGTDDGISNKDITFAVIDESANVSLYMNAIEGHTPSVTGDVEFVDYEGWNFNITGDGTITITTA